MTRARVPAALLGLILVVPSAASPSRAPVAPVPIAIRTESFDGHAPARGDLARVGRWSRPVNVGVTGIHAVLLHTGDVLLWEEPHGEPGSKAKLLDPATMQVTDVSVPYPRDGYCSGTSVMPDGRLLVAGGLQPGTNKAPKATDVFDPVGRRRLPTDEMAAARYYPSLVAMADGTTLVVSGNHWVFGTDTVNIVESYRPASGVWTTLPDSANIETAMYPRTLLLPDGRVVRAGPEAVTMAFDPSTESWRPVARMHDGNRYEGAAVLLPGLHEILTSGGATVVDPGPSVFPTDGTEVIDFADPRPSWERTGSMRKARMYHELVLLADGTVLAVGGAGIGHLYTRPVRDAELYDPATGRWTLMAKQEAPRPYHSTALLLPDGRVLSAGSDFGGYRDTVELYSPPYLFRGSRPRITSAPDAVGYGLPFEVGTPRPRSISRVALIRPGAVTHSVNFDQRYVDVDFRRSTTGLIAIGPASPNLAPPGWYMLVLVDREGVPSVATFVHLDG